MADIAMPSTAAELCGLVREAREKRRPVEVCGFRSKRDAGRPVSAATVISTANLSGVTLYEPNELVISARAGTPLHEIEAVLARNNQELAFEPADLGRLYQSQSMAASIGAVLAMNISGSRRILRGAARDHVLGVRAINGLGESLKFGGRVLKNVTGVDLVRGLSGSWGTLAVLEEVTFKVLPRAPESRTIVFAGLADEAAVGVMSAALGTPNEVSGTIHLQAAFAARLPDKDMAPANTNITALRLEGTPRSLVHRAENLRRRLSPFGESHELAGERSKAFWSEVRALSFLSSAFEKPVWRITAAPSKAPLIVRALSSLLELTAAYEWSGGLLWLELPVSSDANVTEVRRILAEFDADSMLMRAAGDVRESIDVFHPLPLAKMKIVQGIKAAFDPAGILNPGRMYRGV